MTRITELFGERFSSRRRKLNITMVVVLGMVIAWLAWDSNRQGDRITLLERSDCKEARVTGAPFALDSCLETLDHNDRIRTVEGLCIQPRRVGLPCPLSPEQTRRLEAILEGS